MFVAIVLAFSLAVTTFAFHYRVLLWLGSYTPKLVTPKLVMRTQIRVLFIIIVLFFTHVIEIGFYGAVYAWSVLGLGLGTFDGATVNGPMSYLYYSGVIYTSLGLGDILPVGHIRFITAIETLNGLLLITWSTSFTFLAMGQFWQCDSGHGRQRENPESN